EGDPERAALLEGAAEGLRRRVGLPTWPLLRQGEGRPGAQGRPRAGAGPVHHGVSPRPSLTPRAARGPPPDPPHTRTPTPTATPPPGRPAPSAHRRNTACSLPRRRTPHRLCVPAPRQRASPPRRPRPANPPTKRAMTDHGLPASAQIPVLRGIYRHVASRTDRPYRRGGARRPSQRWARRGKSAFCARLRTTPPIPAICRQLSFIFP